MVEYKIRHIPKTTPYNRRPGYSMTPEYITIHSTANLSSTAQNELGWLTNPNNKNVASWHIVVDDKEAIEAIPLNENAWHAGDGREGTGNRRSIGIEICESGDRAETMQNAVEVVARLLKQLNLGTDKLRRHYDWNGNPCPRIMMANNWEGWKGFVISIERELNKEISEPSDWAVEAWDWGTEQGITDGTNPQQPATRQEVVTMLHRLVAKDIIKPIPEPKPSFTHEKIGETEVITLDPMVLKAREGVLKSGKQIIQYTSNFISGNFFWWDRDVPKTIGWLISEGQVLHDRHEYKSWKGNPKGTLIIYRNGQVEVGWMWDSDIIKRFTDIWFCCQGFNLFPPNMNVRDGIVLEGFQYGTVGYTTNRISYGYNKDKHKIVFAVRPQSNAERAQLTMENLGCKGNSICGDSGLSCNLAINGKGYFLTNRILSNYIYW
jgi:N-acetylmuramoyl-L-alanine amidase